MSKKMSLVSPQRIGAHADPRRRGIRHGVFLRAVEVRRCAQVARRIGW